MYFKFKIKKKNKTNKKYKLINNLNDYKRFILSHDCSKK